MSYHNTDAQNALLDVRKSYRLLHAYQSRVLDLVKYINLRFSLSLKTGWPWYCDNHPRGSKAYLSSSAFEWLSMYLYEFNLLDKKEGNDRLSFSVIIIPDTGFFDTEMEWKDRNAVSQFKKAEEADSKILFMIGKNKWHKGAESLRPYFRKDFNEFVDNNDGILLFKSFPLSDFFNNQSVDDKMLEIVAFCSKHSITEFNLLDKV